MSTREEVIAEISNIRQELNILYPQIISLREKLKPLEDLHTELALERNKLERKLVSIKRCPTYYPKKKRVEVVNEVSVEYFLDNLSKEQIEELYKTLSKDVY